MPELVLYYASGCQTSPGMNDSGSIAPHWGNDSRLTEKSWEKAISGLPDLRLNSRNALDRFRSGEGLTVMTISPWPFVQEPLMRSTLNCSLVPLSRMDRARVRGFPSTNFIRPNLTFWPCPASIAVKCTSILSILSSWVAKAFDK